MGYYIILSSWKIGILSPNVIDHAEEGTEYDTTKM